VLIARITRDKTLTRLDSIQPERRMLGGDEQPISVRMKVNTPNLFGLLNGLERLFGRRFGVLEKLYGVISTAA
jgi:hypothetical protein